MGERKEEGGDGLWKAREGPGQREGTCLLCSSNRKM